MRRNVKYSVSALSAFFAIFIFIGSCNSVPVAPNQSTVEGVVSEYAVLSSRLVNVKPEMKLYRITVKVESVESPGGGPNFVSDRIGEDVQMYSKEKISSEIFEKRIKAKVTFRGDERGGMLWIREITIQ